MDNFEPDGFFNFDEDEFGGNDDYDDFSDDDFGDDDFGDDDFGDDDFGDDDFGDDDFGDDGSGRPPSESLDIPDLPESLMIRDSGATTPILSDAELKMIWNDERSSVDTIFDQAKTERIPGISRSLLSMKKEYGPSFGTKLCQSLAEGLNRYSDRLLFGLIDGIYLHCNRSETFERGRLGASVMFFWDEEESPFQLITPNIADITENGELTYLLVGDLLEEFLDGLQKGGNGKNGEINDGDRPKPPGKS